MSLCIRNLRSAGVADDELEFEQVVKFKADYLLVVEAGGTKGDESSREIRNQICALITHL